MRSLAFVALLVATAAATAVAVADDKTQAALLAKGRALEEKGKHVEAIAAYQEYLKSAPDDPIANGELGFAALQAKDYKTAEAATRLAIAHAPAPKFPGDLGGRPRGAVLFNLGMIQEALHAPTDAAVSYAESLRARPSRVVREKLQKLDPAVAATLDPLAPARLPGPFASVRDACRDVLTRAGADPDEIWGESASCDAPDLVAVAGGKAKLGAPFEQVVAFEMGDRSTLDLAVKLTDGWYLFEYRGKGHRSQAHCGGTSFTVKQLGVVKRVVPELRLEYTSEGACDHHDHGWGWTESGTIAIGVGPSGRPAAPPVLVTSQEEWEDADNRPRVKASDVAVKLAWNRDGSLDVTGKVLHPGMAAFQPITEDDLDPDNLLGHHLLAFP